MNVFIMSYKRPACKSYWALNGFKRTVLLHDEDQKRQYVEAGIPPADIVVTNVPSLNLEQHALQNGKPMGQTGQREFAVKKLTRHGEWFLFADDNIEEISGVSDDILMKPSPSGDEQIWGKEDSQTLNYNQLRHRFDLDVMECERTGAHMCGFAVVDNPYFRQKHWRTVGFAIGKMLLWKSDHDYRFDHNITMEDFRNSCEHMMRYGALCIDNWMFPEAKHYQAGGLGTYDSRIPYRLRDVKSLLGIYPELLAVKNREGFVENTDLRVRITSQSQLAKIRTQAEKLW